VHKQQIYGLSSQICGLRADAIVAVEYGELVKSLLDQVEAGEVTLKEVLDRLN